MKKGVIALCTVVLIAFVVVLTTSCNNLDQNEKEKKVMKDDALDLDCGNWIIFDEKGVYGTGSKYGYMDKTGEIKIPAQFDDAYEFSEGFAVVYMFSTDKEPPLPDSWEPYGTHAFINAKGKYVFLCEEGWLTSFSEGIALVRDKEGQYFINTSFEKVFDVANFATIEPFIEGYALVQTKGTPYPSPIEKKWSYIDKTGNLATDKEFEEANPFSEGMAAVKNNGKWGVIDNNFNLVIDYQYDSAGDFSDGLMAVEKDGKSGYIDKTGQVVVDFVYDYNFTFREGLASVSKDGKYGFINTKGEVVIPLKYKYTQGFFEGLSAVKADNGYYGYINTKGEFVIEPIYTAAYWFENGLARVSTYVSNYYFINQNGEIVDPHN